jgi:hypothetical protein
MKVKASEMKDKVLFRKFEDGEVIAIFPDLEWDTQGNVTSYMHIGQHGACDTDLINELEKASESEYKPLADELESIGYKLDIK